MKFISKIKELLKNLFKDSEETQIINNLDKNLDVYSPVKGEIKFLDDLEDDFFSKKITGEGLAVIVNKNTIESEKKLLIFTHL